jgi:plastocyanin
MKKIVVLGLGLILIAAACNKTTQTDNNPTNTYTYQTPAAGGTEQTSVEEVSMTQAGFEPATLTVRKGTTVVFKNNGTTAIWPASAPHPTHTDYPEFDPRKGIKAGESWSFTFEKVGEWKYHDHLNASKFGKVVVVE